MTHGEQHDTTMPLATMAYWMAWEICFTSPTSNQHQIKSIESHLLLVLVLCKEPRQCIILTVPLIDHPGDASEFFLFGKPYVNEVFSLDNGAKGKTGTQG